MMMKRLSKPASSSSWWCCCSTTTTPRGGREKDFLIILVALILLVLVQSFHLPLTCATYKAHSGSTTTQLRALFSKDDLPPEMRIHTMYEKSFDVFNEAAGKQKADLSGEMEKIIARLSQLASISSGTAFGGGTDSDVIKRIQQQEAQRGFKKVDKEELNEIQEKINKACEELGMPTAAPSFKPAPQQKKKLWEQDPNDPDHKPPLLVNSKNKPINAPAAKGSPESNGAIDVSTDREDEKQKIPAKRNKYYGGGGVLEVTESRADPSELQDLSGPSPYSKGPPEFATQRFAPEGHAPPIGEKKVPAWLLSRESANQKAQVTYNTAPAVAPPMQPSRARRSVAPVSQFREQAEVSIENPNQAVTKQWRPAFSKAYDRLEQREQMFNQQQQPPPFQQQPFDNYAQYDQEPNMGYYQQQQQQQSYDRFGNPFPPPPQPQAVATTKPPRVRDTPLRSGTEAAIPDQGPESRRRRAPPLRRPPMEWNEPWMEDGRFPDDPRFWDPYFMEDEFMGPGDWDRPPPPGRGDPRGIPRGGESNWGPPPPPPGFGRPDPRMMPRGGPRGMPPPTKPVLGKADKASASPQDKNKPVILGQDLTARRAAFERQNAENELPMSEYRSRPASTVTPSGIPTYAQPDVTTGFNGERSPSNAAPVATPSIARDPNPIPAQYYAPPGSAPPPKAMDVSYVRTETVQPSRPAPPQAIDAFYSRNEEQAVIVSAPMPSPPQQQQAPPISVTAPAPQANQVVPVPPSQPQQFVPVPVAPPVQSQVPMDPQVTMPAIPVPVPPPVQTVPIPIPGPGQPDPFVAPPVPQQAVPVPPPAQSEPIFAAPAPQQAVSVPMPTPVQFQPIVATPMPQPAVPVPPPAQSEPIFAAPAPQQAVSVPIPGPVQPEPFSAPPVPQQAVPIPPPAQSETIAAAPQVSIPSPVQSEPIGATSTTQEAASVPVEVPTSMQPDPTTVAVPVAVSPPIQPETIDFASTVQEAIPVPAPVTPPARSDPIASTPEQATPVPLSPPVQSEPVETPLKQEAVPEPVPILSSQQPISVVQSMSSPTASTSTTDLAAAYASMSSSEGSGESPSSSSEYDLAMQYMQMNTEISMAKPKDFAQVKASFTEAEITEKVVSSTSLPSEPIAYQIASPVPSPIPSQPSPPPEVPAIQNPTTSVRSEEIDLAQQYMQMNSDGNADGGSNVPIAPNTSPTPSPSALHMSTSSQNEEASASATAWAPPVEAPPPMQQNPHQVQQASPYGREEAVNQPVSDVTSSIQQFGSQFPEFSGENDLDGYAPEFEIPRDSIPSPYSKGPPEFTTQRFAPPGHAPPPKEKKMPPWLAAKRGIILEDDDGADDEPEDEFAPSRAALLAMKEGKSPISSTRPSSNSADNKQSGNDSSPSDSTKLFEVSEEISNSMYDDLFHASPGAPQTSGKQQGSGESSSVAPLHKPGIHNSKPKDSTRTQAVKKKEIPAWVKHNRPPSDRPLGGYRAEADNEGPLVANGGFLGDPTVEWSTKDHIGLNPRPFVRKERHHDPQSENDEDVTP